MKPTTTRPRIGVYTICLNEAKYVRQWVESMYCKGRGAVRAYVLDTGSTDGTIAAFKQALKDLNIPESWLKLAQKKYEHFRFDISRNDNLAMIEPDADKLDALVSVDLDETMIPDFWRDLKSMVAAHPDFERIYYLYAWNHDENGNPKRVFWYDKVHPVKGCRWIHPVHEELVVSDPSRTGRYKLDDDKIYLHHWMDMSKPRSSYLPLLELRASEEPDDIYGLFYLMREYLFTDPNSSKALAIAITAYRKLMFYGKDKYDCLPFFAITIADLFNRLGIQEDAKHFYQRAIDLGPNLRQPYISYASAAAYRGQHEVALYLLALMEERCPDKYPTWYECDYNWTWRPLQIKAVALCHAKRYEDALKVFCDAESRYMVTQTDKDEAKANGFYADYQWLKDHLKIK